jgi:uncharacterized membrane protein required for colicin V production
VYLLRFFYESYLLIQKKSTRSLPKGVGEYLNFKIINNIKYIGGFFFGIHKYMLLNLVIFFLLFFLESIKSIEVGEALQSVEAINAFKSMKNQCHNMDTSSNQANATGYNASPRISTRKVRLQVLF